LGAGAIEAVGEVFADAINFMAWTLFYLWFFLSGTKFMGGKRAVNRFFSAAGGAIAGSIPFLNIGPTITIGVAAIEWHQWKEDQEKAKAANDNAANAREARLGAQREALAQAYAAAAEREAQYLEAA
jgi:hypothetical protein